MKELQGLVAKSVEARGYREGWTDEQFAARQVCKALEELGELARAIGWLYHIPLWVDVLQDAGAEACIEFDRNSNWYQVEGIDPQIAAQELADVAIPLLALADVLGIDLGAAIREKVTGDVARGVRGEKPEIPLGISEGAARLEWSSKPPTEGGWYWWRDATLAIRKEWIVYIEESGESLRAYIPCSSRAHPLGALPGEWAGPLVPPEGAE